MTEIIAVFKSRSQAFDCSEKLKKFNISCGLINTPKEANVGCGLSVKFPLPFYNKSKKIIAACRYSAFYGYLKMENKYGRIYFTPMR